MLKSDLDVGKHVIVVETVETVDDYDDPLDIPVGTIGQIQAIDEEEPRYDVLFIGQSSPIYCFTQDIRLIDFRILHNEIEKGTKEE